MRDNHTTAKSLSKAGQEVYSPLLKDIVSGHLAPGARLQTRRELMTKFNTTSVTVQRAFDRLSEAGFIEGRGRQGTFVVAHPPHRHRIGLVFRSSPEKPEWRHLWTVVLNAAHQIESEGDWSFEPYFDVKPDNPGVDWLRLCHNVKDRHLAGLFFGVRPSSRFEALENLPIPKVALAEMPIKGLSVMTIDQDDFLRKALSWILEKGCRRIGLITVPGHAMRYQKRFEAILSGCGVRTERRWIQLGEQELPEWTTNVAEMMFHGNAKDRPDGLVISDDNLTAHACEGMKVCGLNPGVDVQVVSHANFPALVSHGFSGVQRIGYDNKQMLRDALQSIRKQGDGVVVPKQTFIQACSEAAISCSASFVHNANKEKQGSKTER